MNKLQEIKKLTKKNPLIMNMFIRFYNEDNNINVKKIKWLYSMWNKNKNQLKYFFINYNQIKKIEEFEKMLQQISSDIYNVNVDKQSLINYLDGNENNYEIVDNNICIEINTWKETKLLGSKEWCIVESEDEYNNYMLENDKQFIVFIYDKTNILTHKIGFMTKNNKYIEGYDNNNDKMKYQYKNIINGFNITQDCNNQIKDIWKKPKKLNKRKYKNGMAYHRFIFSLFYFLILVLCTIPSNDKILFEPPIGDISMRFLIITTTIIFAFIYFHFLENKIGLWDFLMEQSGGNTEYYEYNEFTKKEELVSTETEEWLSRENLDKELNIYSISYFVITTTLPLLFYFIN